ncbi:uncharacterized protein LOC112341858 [Selaginella moellendorffii]|uniref:uncharacterized protein LOC112341858 n=1 Tax=Selaginella moellendorffii TaxID=88036 RepID=UPI000D1C99D0|nr:uncharacterized protein LOC112341858 [Selaginella moellendorffii]|eukprot:XP_024518475.1 uncharacterized protein LOC112341858 [Selaginella moellendorffii]
MAKLAQVAGFCTENAVVNVHSNGFTRFHVKRQELLIQQHGRICGLGHEDRAKRRPDFSSGLGEINQRQEFIAQSQANDGDGKNPNLIVASAQRDEAQSHQRCSTLVSQRGSA